MKNIGSRGELKVIVELMLYGLFIRTGQLGSILLALQFDEIFTNPAQLVFLFPAGIAIVIVLVALTFVEIECNSYAEKLDRRLEAVNLYFSKAPLITQKGYLQKTFLQVILNVLALPALGIFLGWTSGLLFIVLILNIICSAIIIFKYNKFDYQKSAKNFKQKDFYSTINSEQVQGKVPFYIITNISKQSAPNDEKIAGLNIAGQKSSSHGSLSGVKKRKLLNLTRQAGRISILVIAAVLVILKVTSVVKVAGFLIIGNFFRSGCISLLEFMSSTEKLFPLLESLELIKRSLIQVSLIEENLLNTYEEAKKTRAEFNNNYSSIIFDHPFFRVKNLTIRDVDGAYIAANMTSRIQLKSITYLYIEGITLANRIKNLLAQHMEDRSYKTYKYLINGDALLGGKKVSSKFFDSITIYNPTKIQILSNNIFNYFDPKSANEIKNVLNNSQELRLFIETLISENVAVEMLSQRQINQIKSIIHLLRLYTEPYCISVAMFIFDCFEEPDANFLINILLPLYQEKNINLIVLGRNKFLFDVNMPQYKLNPDSIRKTNNNGQ